MERYAYGTDPSQYGELHRPAGSPRRGTVVVVHGGFWRARYDASFGDPLARDLARRGWTAWNIEYRRVGNGGGWPATFDDVAAAVDVLPTLDVDTSNVVAVGHSAGGQLATWLAARRDARVPLTGVVAQAGVLDLVTAARERVGGRAVPNLLGGMPDDYPARYSTVDPMQQIPLDVPVVCVHAPADDEVPISISEAYVASATAADARAQLIRTEGDHYTLIDPASPDWRSAVSAIAELTT